jgi:hypothetical protein
VLHLFNETRYQKPDELVPDHLLPFFIEMIEMRLNVLHL